MKKFILIITLIIFISSKASKAQDVFLERSVTIKAFISAVLYEKHNARFIMDNYMYIAANDSISESKKEAVIAAMIDKFKTNSKILASSDYKIVKYADFKGTKKEFNTDDDSDIIVLSVDGKAVDYLYFKDHRIVSFFYIDKGSLSFFVTI